MKFCGCDAEGRLTHIWSGGTLADLIASARLAGCAGWAVCDHYPAPDETLEWTFFED